MLPASISSDSPIGIFVEFRESWPFCLDACSQSSNRNSGKPTTRQSDSTVPCPGFIGEVSGNQGRRVHRRYQVIALEVGTVKGKDALHSINAHHRYEPRVIDLDALDLMVVNDMFPGGIDCGDVRQ